MFTLFDIPHDMLVTGAVQVQHPNAAGTGVDLSRLNPGARAALEAQQAAMGNYQRLDETDDGSSVQTSTISSQGGGAPGPGVGPNLHIPYPIPKPSGVASTLWPSWLAVGQAIPRSRVRS